MPIPTAERVRRTARPIRAADPDVHALRGAIEQRLEALAPSDSRANALDTATRYVLLAPGKRIRPALTVLASWELGLRDFRALDAGCALEMVHAASLVLDDLPCMDDAPRRRGRPSTHVAFGQDVAILAAIALLGRAFSTVAAASHLEPALRTRLVATLAEAVGPDGLSGGQFEDLRKGDSPRALDRIADANHLKTGALFVAAVEMASVIAGANEVALERLRTSAMHLGQAFQLMDDLKDGLGPETAGEDAGKVTIVSVLGSEDARRRLEVHVAQALETLRPGGPLATFVSRLFDGTRGGTSAVSEIRRIEA